MTDTNFDVYVRVRPATSREIPNAKRAVQVDSVSRPATVISLRVPGVVDSRQYTFNCVFPETTHNCVIYEHTLHKLIANLNYGYNSSCFAYGSTGAGKTHTMFGSFLNFPNSEPGIVFHLLKDLFYSNHEISVKFSYLEIYNEHVKDLLNPKLKDLILLEDPVKGIIVTDLLESAVTSIEEVLTLLETGNRNRTMAPTCANEFSTRSHAILQITVETVMSRTQNTVCKFSMIDLAGSERAADTENTGQRMVEGASINRSLLALANCINILADTKKKGRYIPYRDSKLTRLLKDSLGGNSRTIMIACISPMEAAYESTLHTLQYAERAKHIKTRVTAVVKENRVSCLNTIAGLKQEIDGLKAQVTEQGTPVIASPRVTDSIEQLSKKLLCNFEEHWDLKQSIKEIDILNEENYKTLLGLRHNRDNERKTLSNNIQENEYKKKELLCLVNNNLKEKHSIQREVSHVRDEHQKGLLQMQISIRTLKIDKLDLSMQNLQMKQEAIRAEKESQNKDNLISQMRKELETMKEQFEPRRPLTTINNAHPLKIPFPSSPSKLKTSRLDEARKLRKSSSRSIEPNRGTLDFLKNYIPKESPKPDKRISALKMPERGSFSNFHRNVVRNTRGSAKNPFIESALKAHPAEVAPVNRPQRYHSKRLNHLHY